MDRKHPHLYESTYLCRPGRVQKGLARESLEFGFYLHGEGGSGWVDITAKTKDDVLKYAATGRNVEAVREILKNYPRDLEATIKRLNLLPVVETTVKLRYNVRTFVERTQEPTYEDAKMWGVFLEQVGWSRDAPQSEKIRKRRAANRAYKEYLDGKYGKQVTIYYPYFF